MRHYFNPFKMTFYDKTCLPHLRRHAVITGFAGKTLTIKNIQAGICKRQRFIV